MFLTGRTGTGVSQSRTPPQDGLPGIEGASPSPAPSVLLGVLWLDALSLRQASGNAISTAEKPEGRFVALRTQSNGSPATRGATPYLIRQRHGPPGC